MTHLTESQFVRLADASSNDSDAAAHLAVCEACRAELDAQVSARRVLAARPVEPVRDLSAAVRAALDAELPWIERLNWRRLSLRVAPIAAALTLVALLLLRTTDTSTLAETAKPNGHSVASALWSGEVTDDQLLTLVLSARPDEALSAYVQEK